MTREEAAIDIEQNILPIVGRVSLHMAVRALRELDRRDEELKKSTQEALESCQRKMKWRDDYDFWE